MYLEPIEHPDITRACETGYPWSSYSGEDADADEPSECDDCPYGEGGDDDEDSGRGQQDE